MADQYGYVCIMDALTLKPIYQVKGFQNAEVKSSPLVSTRGSSTGEVTVYFSMNALPGGLYAFKDTEGKTSASLHTLYIPQAKQYCLYTIPTTVEPCFVLRLPKISLPQAHRQSQAYRLRQVRRLFLIRLHRRLKSLCQNRKNHIALR